MDKFEGVLEVGRTDDTHEVVINHPDLKPDGQTGVFVGIPAARVDTAKERGRAAGLKRCERKRKLAHPAPNTEELGSVFSPRKEVVCLN